MENKIMGKKSYTWKFWLIFWLAAALALLGWYIFLQIQNKNIENLKPLLGVAPIGEEQKNELATLADIYQKMGGWNGEKTFLVLFQNDMELRPGGGFIGSFGILKTKNGKISDIQVRDTGVFDRQIPDAVAPPEPIADTFHVKGWKLRDSNWSPDFKVNAENAENLYHLGGGGENFDGAIAMNTSVLNSLLAITGPVKIEGYPGEYSDETAILQLEYQVEKGYLEQGIQKVERKSIMKEMADVLIAKIHNFSISQQLELAQRIEDHLQKKDIQIFFKDRELQNQVEAVNWGGRVKDFDGDFLMIVDANLNSLKSDICLRRSADYSVDLRGENPHAVLKIAYEHTCRAKDWMTTNYNDWARVYVSAGSWLLHSSISQNDMTFDDELGKKVFGFPVYIPIGQTETVSLEYNLPSNILKNTYSLLIQKQSGSGGLALKINIIQKDGSEKTIEEKITGDKQFTF